MARSLPVFSLSCVAALIVATGTARAEGETGEAAVEANAPGAGAETLERLGASLAAAKAEAERHKAESERLRLQAEALGIAAVGADVRTLQERLISAAADLRIAEKEKQTLTARLVSLSEAALALLSDPDNPQGRERLREELGGANRDLLAARGSVEPPPVELDAARVVSQKPDLNLVVINVGRLSGLRTGTPMKIVRNEQTIASGLVVDVRNRISGLLITSAEGRDAVRTGDLVKPETTQSSN